MQLGAAVSTPIHWLLFHPIEASICSCGRSHAPFILLSYLRSHLSTYIVLFHPRSHLSGFFKFTYPFSVSFPFLIKFPIHSVISPQSLFLYSTQKPLFLLINFIRIRMITCKSNQISPKLGRHLHPHLAGHLSPVYIFALFQMPFSSYFNYGCPGLSDWEDVYVVIFMYGIVQV